MNQFTYWLKRSSPTILTWVGAIGTLATGTTAALNTPKAMKRLEAAKAENGGELTIFEKIRAVAPAYFSSIGCAAGTIACIFGANSLNHRQQAALVSAYTVLDRIHKEYVDKTKELYGDEADRKIRKEIVQEHIPNDQLPPWDENQIFYEEHYGKFFERTKEQVLTAEYHFNRNFALLGYASLNDFYEFLGLPKTEEGETLGWSLVAGEIAYGYSWVDFEHRTHVMENGLVCCEIYMPFPPTADYLGGSFDA